MAEANFEHFTFSLRQQAGLHAVDRLCVEDANLRFEIEATGFSSSRYAASPLAYDAAAAGAGVLLVVVTGPLQL